MTRGFYLGVASLALLSTAVGAHAQVAGVQTLLSQAAYWQGKGRQDLANQAYRRVLAIDPANAAARRGLNGPTPAPAPAATKPPAVKPTPATPVVRAPVQRPVAVATPAPKPVPAPRPSPPADVAGDSRTAGFRQLNANDLEGATRGFRRALALRPNDADALGGMGIVKLRQKQFAEARDYLTRASARGPAARWAEALSSARFYAGLDEARAAQSSGRIDEAQKIAEDLSNSDSPQRGPALELLASIYETKGHFAEAAALYQTAAKLGGTAPASVAGNERRATRAQAMQAAAARNDSEAERLFQLGLMESPGDPWIRYDYARFLDQRGRRGEVLSIISALPQLSGPEPLYAAALLSSQIGRDVAADTLMARIPEGQRTAEMRGFAAGLKIDAAVARGKMLAARGEAPEAIAALGKFARTPGLTMAKQGQIAGGLLELGDKAGAAALAQQALASGSSNAADYEGIIRVLAQTGQDGLATAAVQKAATAAGTLGGGERTVARLNGIVVVAQADRMREEGQYAPAFDLLQGAWQASPGNTDILGALARLYQSGGLLPQAAQTFQLVLKEAPTDKGALIGLIDTAGSTGDYALARQALDRAVRLDPNDYATYLAAARMERSRGDEGASSRYLKRARELYLQQTQASGGGFASTNPFAASTGSGATLASAPVNPFDLGRSSGRQSRLPDVPAGAAGFDRLGELPGTLPRGGSQPRDDDRPQRRVAIGDPVLQSISDDLESLASNSGTRADVKTEYRQRSGEVGLSKSQTVSGTAELSTGLAGGRVSASATALAIDAGRPVGSGLARFGRNATREAEGIVAAKASELVAADTQQASGVAVSAGYSNGFVKADVGTTPLGFGKTGIVGGVTLSPRLSPSVTAKVWAERRPVEDSVVAYAGTRDPVSGDFWGAVRRAGGGASMSYDVGGTGVYADGSYYAYKGSNVRSNHGIQANVGGYTRVYRNRNSTLSIGINGNYQDYANDQNYFTYGQGGYFSPQSFLSISFPVHYNLRQPGGFEVDVNAAPGYQSYNQQSTALYPTDTTAQARLDALKALNNDVRSRFDSISQTGFGLAAGGSVYYPLNPRMKVGGEANYNTFGAYNEFRGSVGIKQVLGGN
ncbi:cellulose synthase subunit BcsC-related outer membrane protein [Glacieibacterium sp.]|uniref:cellulose biosynthesis protein BcsC n=1 Tax=Glacieibacterium sp. TaxID=2860237 RepID=UPI003AFFE900